MCGFIASVSRRSSPRVLFRNASDSRFLMSRGRDGFGVSSGRIGKLSFFLSHFRLAIVDVSSAPQPLDRFGVTIVFNGEIYNYLSLRRELETQGFQFKTETDTEVICAAVRHWGISALNRFNGVFALACFDSVRGDIFFARDQLGVKPLYLWQAPDEVIISSDPREIASITGSKIDLEATFVEAVSFGYIGGTRTPFRDIFKVAKNSVIKISEGKESINLKKIDLSFGDLTQKRFVMDDEVLLQVPSEVKWGVQISGGIDSTAILVSAAKQGFDPRGYFVNFKSQVKSSEVKNIGLMRAAGFNILEVTIESADYVPLLDSAISRLHAPITDSALVPLMALTNAAAKDGIKVLLSGTGGDELFMGYARYFVFHRTVLRKLIKKAPLEKLFRKLGVVAVNLGFLALSRVFVPSLDMRFAGTGTRGSFVNQGALKKVIRRILDNDFDAHFHIDPYSNADINNYLSNALLTQQDQILMASQIEGRVPLLTPRTLSHWGSGLARDRSKIVLRHWIRENSDISFNFEKKHGFGSVSFDLLEDRKLLFRETNRLLNKHELTSFVDIGASRGIDDAMQVYSVAKWLDINAGFL
jgi:asparagine synthase (glutamine-hydrolysing)